MRAFMLGAVVFLAVAAPVVAQNFTNFFTGANPRDIKMVPLDTSKAMRNTNVNGVFRTPPPAKTFNLTNLFPKVGLPSWPPVLGKSQGVGTKIVSGLPK